MYSGLRSRNGASYAILETLDRGKWILVLSNTVLTEYEEVLKRELHTLSISLQSLESFLDALSTAAERHTPSEGWVPVLSDPDDEAFLRLATDARADFIVTHNLSHFAVAQRLAFGPKVLAPRDFLRIIGT